MYVGGNDMRLYSIYYLCRKYKDDVTKCNIQEATVSGGGKIVQWKNWKTYKEMLLVLREIKCLKMSVEAIYEKIPVIEREKTTPTISMNLWREIRDKQNELSMQLEVITTLYESMGLNEKTEPEGIDVKIPKCDSLGKYIALLKDVQFVFEQCPFLKNEEGAIEFSCVDVGSQWLSFLITAGIGSGAVAYIFKNLASMLDKAIQLKSHMNSLKEQKILLEKADLSKEVLETTLNTYKVLNDQYISRAIKEIEEENAENALLDGEERGKAEKSLEKLAELMDKGVEIYTSIDTNKDIQLLFPTIDGGEFLPSNIIKYLEDKKHGKDD